VVVAGRAAPTRSRIVFFYEPIKEGTSRSSKASSPFRDVRCALREPGWRILVVVALRGAEARYELLTLSRVVAVVASTNGDASVFDMVGLGWTEQRPTDVGVDEEGFRDEACGPCV
jgi:hypothetical protein